MIVSTVPAVDSNVIYVRLASLFSIVFANVNASKHAHVSNVALSLNVAKLLLNVLINCFAVFVQSAQFHVQNAANADCVQLYAECVVAALSASAIALKEFAHALSYVA